TAIRRTRIALQHALGRTAASGPAASGDALPAQDVSRRTLVRAIGLAAGWCVAYVAMPLLAQVRSSSPRQGISSTRRQLTLNDLLARGLRARRVEEFEFIDKVVELVEQNKLPLRLVQAAYLWSRNKRPYPMIYFQQALIRLAAREGIAI